MRAWPLRQRRSPPEVRRIDEHLERTSRRLRGRSRLEVNVYQHETITQRSTDLQERITILGILMPHREVSVLLTKGSQDLFPDQPAWLHILTKVIHEAQERIHGLTAPWLRPLAQLLDFARLDSASFRITNATPELNPILVVLTLTSFELKATTRSLFAQALTVLDVLLERCTTDQNVVHARTHELLTLGVTQRPELLRDVALHLGRSWRWTKRHPQPLVQPRPRTDHQHTTRVLVQLELSVTPDGIDHSVMLFERSQTERTSGISRRKRADLELFVDRTISANHPTQKPLGILVDYEHRRGPLGKPFLSSVDLTQLPQRKVLFDVELDPQIVIRRDRDWLPSHRLGVRFQPERDHMVSNQRCSTSIDPEALRELQQHLIEEPTRL